MLNKNVKMSWTKSPSSQVEDQRVTVHVVNGTETEIVNKLVGPDVSETMFEVIEGSSIRGSVNTMRGEESALAVGDVWNVGLNPLAPASGIGYAAV